MAGGEGFGLGGDAAPLDPANRWVAGVIFQVASPLNPLVFRADRRKSTTLRAWWCERGSRDRWPSRPGGPCWGPVPGTGTRSPARTSPARSGRPPGPPSGGVEGCGWPPLRQLPPSLPRSTSPRPAVRPKSRRHELTPKRQTQASKGKQPCAPAPTCPSCATRRLRPTRPSRCHCGVAGRRRGWLPPRTASSSTSPSTDRRHPPMRRAAALCLRVCEALGGSTPEASGAPRRVRPCRSGVGAYCLLPPDLARGPAPPSPGRPGGMRCPPDGVRPAGEGRALLDHFLVDLRYAVPSPVMSNARPEPASPGSGFWFAPHHRGPHP